MVADGHALQPLEMLLHEREGVQVADPIVERGRALQVGEEERDVLDADPLAAAITSERKRSRKVCVVRSCLPERKGAKCSGGGRSTPGGIAMMPKGNRFFAALVISKVTLPGATVPPSGLQELSSQPDLDALLCGGKRGIDEEHEPGVAVGARAAQRARRRVSSIVTAIVTVSPGSIKASPRFSIC